MKQIYASKMFKASKNKDKIKASIADPVNAELVQQLREYLDDDYLTTEYFGDSTEQDDTSGVSEGESEVDEGGQSADDATSNESDDSENAFTDDEIGNVDVGGQSADSGESEEGVVAEATRISASTTIDGLAQELSSLAEALKGTLNTRQDTCGVVRVSCKEDELWIYYNDKINLNNVMGPVIDLLNAAAYTYLEFNRLARTDNAMVFQISFASSNVVKPMSGEDDGSKE